MRFRDPGRSDRGVLSRKLLSFRVPCCLRTLLYVAPVTGCPNEHICFPVSTINLLEDTAQSWYDAGYVNVRRRYSHGLTFLGNYTWSKNLSNAPDFRSPMFESSIPQNNNDLAAEKGPGCDVRHRFAMSAVYSVPGFTNSKWTSALTKRLAAFNRLSGADWISVHHLGLRRHREFRHSAGGKSDPRELHRQPVFGSGTRTATEWFNPAAFAAPAAYTFGNAGRNSVYGPGMQTLDFAVARKFSFTERAKFQFRGEFFNALNHTNLGTPDRFVNTPQFGTITEATTPGREIQLSARLSFLSEVIVRVRFATNSLLERIKR